MANKSVCIVSAQYLPHVGGVEQYVDNFARELERQGSRVTIVTSQTEGAENYEKSGNIEIFRLPSWQLMDGRFPVLKYNGELRSFTKAFKKRKFDVMLVNTRFYLMSLYAVRLAKKMKLRCIMLDHGTSHLNTGGRITSKLGEIFEHGITWLEKRYCKEFAGVSRATLEWIRHFHINSDLVLYNSIDVDKFEDMEKQSERDFRKEFGIPENDIIVSFVGRLTVEKGIKELADAVAEISGVRNNIWLVAAGDGYMMEEIKAINCKKICLTGKMPLYDVAALLKASSIFCLPSVSEGFPTSVLEAVVCKSFIITTYRGGTKELISSREYGIVLKDNNRRRIYNAILYAADNKEYVDKAIDLSYNKVLENYTWKHTVTKFLSILE